MDGVAVTPCEQGGGLRFVAFLRAKDEEADGRTRLSRNEVAGLAIQLAGAGEAAAGEGFEQGFDAFAALGGLAGAESVDEAFRGERFGRIFEKGQHGDELSGSVARPFWRVDDGHNVEVDFLLGTFGPHHFVAKAGDLVVWAEPEDEAARFFGGTLLVEGDQSREEIFFSGEMIGGFIGGRGGGAGMPMRRSARSL
jgi:hypothetical protein